MNCSLIEKNLLILLDPTGLKGAGSWRFIHVDTPSDARKAHDVVFCFNRRELIRYFLCLLSVRLNKVKTRVRKILYINDGLLSCFVSADSASGYRAFARRHVSSNAGGLRQRLSKMLPPALRAEQLFIAVEDLPESGGMPGSVLLGGLDFMFYSNAPGKLLLTKAETFISGRGLVFKTTSSADYAANLEREYETVRTISERMEWSGVPDVGQRLRTHNRLYYPETYLSGANLRSRLRCSGHSSSHHEAIQFLDRLDAWFRRYHALFTGAAVPLASLYAAVVADFSRLNAHSPDIIPLVKLAEDVLSGMDNGGGGLVPIVAHNDLWPGNFIVTEERLTAIDWERATPDSAPLFDYFWMMISAVLEYRVGHNGVQDYSLAFRQFLACDDDVCSHGRTKLRNYLDSLGLESKKITQFILLFLMEWSIQGARALGMLTSMDLLAREELVAFVRTHRDEFNLESLPELTGTGWTA